MPYRRELKSIVSWYTLVKMEALCLCYDVDPPESCCPRDGEEFKPAVDYVRIKDACVVPTNEVFI